ncbi:MAG TPA: CocE/NonD family hydrolase [Mycobacteriales bacterium]|nr:CocE/NonD family hydrolase [Mycobacteriales bacterium]
MRKHATTLRITLVGALIAALFTGLAAGAATATASPFVAAGSARQVYATGLHAGSTVILTNGKGETVAKRKVNYLGGVLFRDVKPGTGYHVKQLPSGPRSKALTVHNDNPAQWNPSIYKQPIQTDGYGYMTTRDGTKLAYRVWLPTELGGAEGTPGLTAPGGPAYSSPYPTLIEYSGYGYANPKGPTNGIAAIANAMGFAVVDIQMRGTGCSAGAFDFFEPLQSIDGYDIVETFARQPWVKDHKVGMFGISYGGISQLFTAATRPPSLEAIAPLSVIDATATTLYPGGIRNDGFAVAWAKERQAEAQPAGQGKKGTQPYAEDQIKNGDTVCKANQVLHPEAANLLAKIQANQHYIPSVADPLDPVTFVHKINVPVFMACQFEDEQTGGHCPTLAEHMTGTTKKWFTFTNGPHIDSLSPETYNRMYDFLSIYVGHNPPGLYAAQVQASAPVVYQAALGVPQNDWDMLPFDPIQADPTVDQAKTDFEALPSIRVLFDNGAGSDPEHNSNPGDPYPQFEQSFKSFPIPGTVARRFYFGPGGTMTDAQPSSRGTSSFTADPHALALTDYGQNTGTGGLWGSTSQWDWKWKANPAGTAVSYLSAPLAKDTAIIGAGAVYAWVKSSQPDVDLQATVSEVTPDGNETFVQNGYLRASERKLSYDRVNVMNTPSTLLEPVPSMLARDVQPMPAEKYVRVAIPLYYEGHVYRAGTRIRITIAGVNGAQPIWSFSHTVPAAQVSLAFSPTMPSMLVLPVVPGVDAQGTSQPPCPGLRNEPCRTYVPFTNEP